MPGFIFPIPFQNAAFAGISFFHRMGMKGISPKWKSGLFNANRIYSMTGYTYRMKK
jgi:hypothetical protein